MRVLIVADTCNPEWPSLPIVAYKAASSISRVADTVVVTNSRNKEAIERAGGMGEAEVVYVTNEYVAAPIDRLSNWIAHGKDQSWTLRSGLGYLPNIAFERGVLKRFRSELDSGGFDVVHRLTPMSPVIPSPLACWTKTPFVLGPLNGGLRWPREYTAELRKSREYFTHVRNLYRLMPYYRRSLRHTAAILASFDHTIAGLPSSVRAKTIDFPEVGVDPDVFHYEPRPAARRLTFVFAGRLVPYKCPDVAVAAFAQSEVLRSHRLVILGDGAERAYLEEMIREHRLEGIVELKGTVTQSQVASVLAEAHVFVFPSIRELGAGVVVEAMASGCVPVVVDYGGPGGLVVDGTGVKVPLDEKSVLTTNLRIALEELASEPQRLPAMSANAHRHAIDNYSWDAKARKTLEAYEWALGRRRTAPTFGDGGRVSSEESGELR